MKYNLFNSKKKVALALLSEKLQRLEEQVSEASGFVNEIEKGNFQRGISDSLSKSELGTSLMSMKVHLDKIANEEEIRNWLNTGLATFSDILRNKKSLNLKDLADDILMNLVKYVSANQGAIFTLEDDGKGDQFLKMISCYAYNRKKYLEKRVELGEGLAGQCILERQPMYLKEVPKDYVTITSGLGGATPRSVFISPLLLNDNIFGVIELASLSEFKQQHLDFINKLSENVAATIKSVKDSERTLALLNSSQQQAEELRATEEEIRQNMEEMQATQEEMKRKSDELSRASAEMAGIFNGINATMATIEFEPDGTILNANENFLKTVKYSIEKIKGKHHRMFVPHDILESADYKTQWKRLASGESITGIFKRISSVGDTIWLNAIYNPILNANGDVLKVVKFATDITQQQEMLAENRGILGGINATMATIEFKPDGTIVNANEVFLRTMICTLEKIKGKHHKIFAPKDVLDSDDYKTFWERLASGKSISGIFKRISLSGDVVWLNAIYNPIYNANGDVVKVIKFATDITSEKQKEAEVQQMLEETKAQEEELRQNMEEMQATQEEMDRRSIELRTTHAEMSGILDGINATMATIEFTRDGYIVNANENFMRTMGVTLDKIVNQHHRVFVPDEILQTEHYSKFWSSLASGQPNKGLFKSKRMNGDVVWLDAIYAPIKNAEGAVIKVIKLATDVTAMQELLEKKAVIRQE
jgi:PAS domain S-box-containing protein